MDDRPKAPMPVVSKSGWSSRERRLSIDNLYSSDYGGVDFYDLEAWEKWNADRTEANKVGLPWEITSDDRRKELNLTEGDARSLHAQLGEYIGRWDEEDARRARK